MATPFLASLFEWLTPFQVSMATPFQWLTPFQVESRHDAIVQFKGFNGSKVFEDLKDSNYALPFNFFNISSISNVILLNANIFLPRSLSDAPMRYTLSSISRKRSCESANW